MKYLMALMIFFTVTNLVAQTTEIYDLYDMTYKQPHWLEIDRTDDYKVEGFRIFAKIEGKTFLLFNFDREKIGLYFEITADQNSTSISTNNFFYALYDGEYSSAYGDATITNQHEYGISLNITDGCKTYDEDEYEKCHIDVANIFEGEMAMWGSLISR
ncbi:MAG: hypothetical protein A2381_14280 [Bdellovibrionales bacterium RIFOXYB1_FULL_37_110]|nr:MAG: hypothetical protein A2417_07050 [Bdellovibrionales bacterium RIFOXYC1_FULL_37_79]OFZ57510.1 MAG: hypothetical protein A2381_14280 [Bdellovibrionales bacterium RIFOXYB1_FULL_37_110]OFZ62981.1 MAG: hypothetical protein A2577_07560 [Bdellovibrionales bacterium RIFOXYD1_FULL_36_51]